VRSDRERLLDILEAQMVAMRNVLIHGHFDIDVDLVWSVVQNDLPKLAAQVRAIVDETR
jgi:uncharacterized protein with HEPN domain